MTADTRQAHTLDVKRDDSRGRRSANIESTREPGSHSRGDVGA